MRPLECPVCGEDEFTTPRDVSSHFAASDDHSRSAERDVIRKLERERVVPDGRGGGLTDRWIDEHAQPGWYLEDVPVHSPPKPIDLVVIPDEDAPAEGNRIAGPSEDEFVRLLIDVFEDGSVPVKVYEVATELQPGTIGRLLVAVYYLSEWYTLPADGEFDVVERGVIYSRGDEMAEQVAPEYDIALYRI